MKDDSQDSHQELYNYIKRSGSVLSVLLYFESLYNYICMHGIERLNRGVSLVDHKFCQMRAGLLWYIARS